MDLKGSLTDCTLRIYPSEKLIAFLGTVPIRNNPPSNLLKFTKSKGELNSIKKKEDPKPAPLYLNDKDVDNLSRIKAIVNKIESTKSIESESETGSVNSSEKDDSTEHEPSADVKGSEDKCNKGTSNEKKDAVITENVVEQEANDKEDEPTTKKEGPYLTRHDVDWLFAHLAKRRQNGEKDLPYLHELLQGSTVDMPENKIMKRNPELEARCVKLRAQQEAREYRQMTKGVDNVRIRYPDDSISYQLKQVNRQLIAVGQFIISIFAGFLFGFKGVEWMIGSLDFGFRLLLGVMCALVIALAEIYFLAKKLNEELNVPETVQLGGPTKFADETINGYTSKDPGKEHQD